MVYNSGLGVTWDVRRSNAKFYARWAQSVLFRPITHPQIAFEHAFPPSHSVLRSAPIAQYAAADDIEAWNTNRGEISAMAKRAAEYQYSHNVD